jgi:2-dehydro-3-deoxyphosphogluconate aldolase / (4S)-4-hydroxy-2-oxoglutarate aldolase
MSQPLASRSTDMPREQRSLAIADVLAMAPVIPVVVIEDAGDAVALARALVRGGLPVIEITLRTAAALEAIGLVRRELPDAIVGAGTVVFAEQIGAALTAGAQFLVTPGTSPTLLDALETSGAPFLPGAATASELVALAERGVSVAKFFPASEAGGPEMLRALAGPFPGMRFCPTGGLDQGRAAHYLALANVACVAGSWMLPSSKVRSRDWETIRVLAEQAASLRTAARPEHP